MNSEKIEKGKSISSFPEEVEVKFITNTFPEKVTETPFKVPSQLTRQGLSEIINHLLNKGDQVVPFEFLITKNEEKVFLRTSLKDFFTSIKEYPENTVTLEYLEASPSPKSVETIPHDDWVSSISTITENLLITGCYDGFCRVIDPNTGNIITQIKHDRPIVNVASVKRKNDILFGTASRSENANVWKYDGKNYTQLLELTGHKSNVECIEFNPLGNMAVTGSDDKSIKIWQLQEKTESEPKQKKPKVEQEICLGTINEHTGCVTSVAWGQKGNVIYSGSFDHSIRLWDVARAHPISAIHGSKVITSLSVNEELTIIATAHPDYMIRLWDPRKPEGKPTLLKSHKSWVRRVKWNPFSTYQLMSCGDDNMVKIWDLRSSVPLYSILHSTEKKIKRKVLSIDFSKDDGRSIFTGSDDCTLKKHKF